MMTQQPKTTYGPIVLNKGERFKGKFMERIQQIYSFLPVNEDSSSPVPGKIKAILLSYS